MEKISQELIDFIRSNFLPIEILRIFLLLRSTKETVWDLEGLSARLHFRPEDVQEYLNHATEKGFVKIFPSGGIQYNSIPELEPWYSQVAELDRERPVTLIQLVYDMNNASKNSTAT